MAPLQIFFIVGTIAWTLVSLALSIRQSRCVGTHRDAVPPDFVASLSLDEHRKAADYTQAREALARWETIADAAVAIAWAAGGITLLYNVLAAVIPLSLTRSVAFLVATGVVSAIVSMPFEVFRTFGLEQRFGFNRSSVGQFVFDRVKRAILSLALAVPLLYALFFAMRNLTGLWWLWAWIGLVALMMGAPSFYVRIVAPRFNRFEPLPDGELKSRIEALLARCGFRSSGLFLMDASRRTKHGNAYFIGFGRTKRIVLFDTLAERCTPEEIEAVVAHELGHFLHRHVLYGLLRTAVMLFLVLAAFGWLTKQPWLLPAFGIPASDDALALFVCLLLASIVGPLAAPIGNWISRRNEYQADDHARRVVGVEPMVSALVGLARDNASTLTPDPLYSLVHHSHPPVPLRVRSLRRGDEPKAA
ncbi:MAG TPA: M48 family metallopeptidase [Beijerinckiaceae bacterium]|nr:M48 family metallopeptidase [Beijerinckiaceae bacterium]